MYFLINSGMLCDSWNLLSISYFYIEMKVCEEESECRRRSLVSRSFTNQAIYRYFVATHETTSYKKTSISTLECICAKYIYSFI